MGLLKKFDFWTVSLILKLTDCRKLDDFQVSPLIFMEVKMSGDSVFHKVLSILSNIA